MNVATNYQALRGRLKRNEPMAKHTSWRVGGPADSFYQPADLQDLVQFLKQLPATEPCYWIGLGSNLLVRDAGVRGTVIATSGALKQMHSIEPGCVRAEVGVACAKVARFSVAQGLQGAEFLAGIPGTIGGALAMNAGAFGGETWEVVQAVETIDRFGQIRLRRRDEFEIAYRHIEMPAREWFVAGHFALPAGDAVAGKAKIKQLLAKRGASQPTQLPNAGSVFKNPPGDHAARLIEASGLKGVCQGGACVSTLHSNFIINTGDASAAEIETLIDLIQQRVQAQQGVLLQPEVRMIGEAL